MGVIVQNVTGSTAMVMWPVVASCADSFYSIMYHPNWDSMLSGYSRKSFQREERVPASQSSFVIENLTPLTKYILCVTCQSANPSSDQCRIFQTREQDLSSISNRKKDLALGIWLTSSVLFLIIAGILLYGCLNIWCRRRKEPHRGLNRMPQPSKREGCRNSSSRDPGALEKSSQPLVPNLEGQQADEVQLTTIKENLSIHREAPVLKCNHQQVLWVTGQPPHAPQLGGGVDL
ncbi:fibronectin type III domain-containing protein 9-like [Petaurus breviceps papuanus]|uniref:fibronectin type III domain-containing protein 9-like n=1 Tax=Petaurus breviceps papuanus TaxID=3040969 RepID=UPI0036DDEC4C